MPKLFNSFSSSVALELIDHFSQGFQDGIRLSLEIRRNKNHQIPMQVSRLEVESRISRDPFVGLQNPVYESRVFLPNPNLPAQRADGSRHVPDSLIFLL